MRICLACFVIMGLVEIAKNICFHYRCMMIKHLSIEIHPIAFILI